MGVTKDGKDWESCCPYVGLRAFEEQDSEYFGGRYREIKRISDSLCAFRLTILYGPSGIGKSSVLQAGVVPRLRERKRNIVVYFSDWQSQDAVERLRSRCYEQISRTPPLPAGEEDEDVPPVPGPLDQLGRTTRGLIFLILDQFEEYLLVSKENPSFDAELARVINNEDVNVHVLIGIRQEDLSKLDRFRPRIPNLLGNALRLAALTPKGAEEALRLPVKTYNRLCPPEFTVAMGADKENDPVPEIVKRAHSSEIAAETEEGGEIEASFLQLVMSALWEKETNEWKKRDGSGQRQLRLTTLKELGGVSGITQRYLQREMKEQLTPAQRFMSGKMFREMVSSTGERISRHKERLIKFAGAPEERVLKVLTILEDRWIVRRIPPASYEVRPALSASVWAWQKSYFQQLWLWIGVGSLVLVAALFAGLVEYFNPQVNHFKKQAIQNQEYAQVYWEAQQNIGLDPALSIPLAAAAIGLADDPERTSAAQDTLENAMDIAHLPLPPSVPDSFPRGRLYVCETNSKGCTEDYRQNFSFTSVSFSQDEKLLAAAFQNKVRVWDLESGKAFNLPDEDNVSISGISDAVFSPDGKMIGAATDDGNARIWERSPNNGGGPTWSLKTWGTRDYLGHHDGQVWGIAFDLAFDPKRPLVATAGEDKTVKIWNLQTGELIRSLNGHTAEVVSVVFSPDGKKLASASRDHNAIVWNVDSWRATPLKDEGRSTHTSGVYGVAFSPKGDRLATTGLDGFVKIWDVATGNRLNSFRPGPDTLWGVAFSPPDGAWLAVAGRDGVASIWDWPLEKELFTLLCGAKGLTDLTFSSRGNLLAAGTKQGYVQIWDVAATRIFPKAGQITGATFYRVPPPAKQVKPTKLAVISTDKGVWLRDASELNSAKPAAENGDKKDSSRQFGGSDRRYTAVAFDPKSGDPGILAAGDTAGRVQVFSESGQEIMNAKAGREVGALAFHPSGLYIAIGDRQDAGLRIWDLKAASKDNKVRMIVGPGERDHPVWLDRIVAVAFSPDGKYLAAGGSAKGTEKDALGEVRIWSFKEPNNPNQVFKDKFCHSVRALDFSLNNHRLAVGCDDGSTWIWDFEKARRLPLGEGKLLSHQSSIYSISFDVHKDLHSDEIATASADGTAKVWDANTGKLLGTYYGHSGGVLAAYLYAHDELATVGTDKTLQFLDLKDLELGGALERARRLGGPPDTK